ncbi:unnamed protein product [Closterium sp. NIES-64]|nr:unnamed protein product [Closterium sp. NIES-64]
MNQPQIFEDDAGRTDTGSFDPPPIATGGSGGDGGGGGAASWIAPVAAGLGGFALGHMMAGGGGGSQWGGGGSPWHRDSGCRHGDAQPGAATPWGHGGGARRWPAHPVVAHSGRFPEERYRRSRPPTWMVVMKWLPWVAVAVALWLYVFAYASTSVDLHPHEHRMLPRFSPFVAGVQVSPLALMPSPPPVLVTFTRYPPIVNEEWATGRPNVRVEPYSYRSWLFHFNKWSQITLSFSDIRSYRPLDLLVIEGSSQMGKFKTDPRAFTGALRKYFLSGDDAVTFQVPRDNDYYFVLVNYNAYPATVALVHFEVTSVLYDISKGKKSCKIRNKHPPPLGSLNESDGMDRKTLTNVTSGPMRMAMPMPIAMPMNGSSAVVPRSAAELMPPAADAENVTATYTSDGDALTDSDDDDDDDDYGFCSAKLPLWETRYVVLAAPKTNKADSTWHVQVAYQPRWLAYLTLVGIPCLLSLIALSIYRCQQYLQHRSDSMRQPSALASISTDPSPLPSALPSEQHPLLAPTDSPPLYTPPDQATAAACSDVCTASQSQAPIPDTWAVTTTADTLPGSSAPSAPPLESSPGKAEAGIGATGQGSGVAGGSGSGVGKEGEGEDQDKNCCCVCMENPRNAVILDCGHRATCYSCGQELMRMANKRCPICRREVRDVTRIYDA